MRRMRGWRRRRDDEQQAALTRHAAVAPHFPPCCYSVHTAAGKIGAELAWFDAPPRCVVTQIMEHAQAPIGREVSVGDRLLLWNGEDASHPTTVARIEAHAREAHAPRVHLHFERVRDVRPVGDAV